MSTEPIIAIAWRETWEKLVSIGAISLGFWKYDVTAIKNNP